MQFNGQKHTINVLCYTQEFRVMLYIMLIFNNTAYVYLVVVSTLSKYGRKKENKIHCSWLFYFFFYFMIKQKIRQASHAYKSITVKTQTTCCWNKAHWECPVVPPCTGGGFGSGCRRYLPDTVLTLLQLKQLFVEDPRGSLDFCLWLSADFTDLQLNRGVWCRGWMENWSSHID